MSNNSENTKSMHNEKLIEKYGIANFKTEGKRDKILADWEKKLPDLPLTKKVMAKERVLDEIDVLDAKAEKYLQAYLKKRIELWNKYHTISEKSLDEFKKA